MKKYLVKIIIMCVAFFLMVVCILEIKDENRMLEYRKDYQVISGETSLLVDDMDIIEENFSCVEGCYSIYEAQNIEGIVGNTETVTVIAESCDSNKLFSSVNVLFEDDRHGCLLDEATMYSLFGTSVSTGQTVTYNGKSYVVRGTVKGDVPVMIINYQDDTSYVDGLIINTGDELYRGQYENNIASAYGVSGQSYYFKEFRSIGHMIQMPGKWSDFAAWGDTFDTIKEWFSHILFENKDVPEQLNTRMGYRYFAYYVIILISAICLIVSAVKCILLYQRNRKI